jgi:hypothetical protein
MNPTPKQRSVIYRKAAELIDSGKLTYCCYALAELVFKNRFEWDSVDSKLFPEMFLFENYRSEAGWFGFTFNEENQQARIFALLFASEIAKQK